MEIKVTIDAPGLEGAIHTLAQVLGNYEYPAKLREGEEKVPVEQNNQPAPQAPPQQQQAQPQTPTQQQQAPAQPQQQAPVQQNQPAPQAQPQQQQPPQGAVPTSNPTYTQEQLGVAATQLVDAGKRDQVVALLGEFGVQALTALPQEQYGAFATKLRELGAKI